jgi:hypothetical protein
MMMADLDHFKSVNAVTVTWPAMTCCGKRPRV